LVAHHYVPQWPSTAVHLHPYDRWGCDFPLLSNMQHAESDSHLLWSTAGMLVAIPSLWEKTDEAVNDVFQWQGWMLAHLASVCYLKHKTKGSASPFTYKTDPFSNKRIDELLVKMGMREPPVSDESEEEPQEDSNDADGDHSVNGDGAGPYPYSDILSLGSESRSLGVTSFASELVGEFSDGGNVDGSEEGSSIISGVGSMNAAEVGPAFVFHQELPIADIDIDDDNQGMEIPHRMQIPHLNQNRPRADSGGFGLHTENREEDSGSILSLHSSVIGNSGNHSSMHTDGTFHAEDIVELMSAVTGVETVSDMVFTGDGFAVKESSQIAIVFSCEGRRRFPLHTIAGGGDNPLELRFVSGRELFKKGSSEFAFMHHGGERCPIGGCNGGRRAIVSKTKFELPDFGRANGGILRCTCVNAAFRWIGAGS